MNNIDTMWKSSARKSQLEYFEVFKSRPYDEIPKSNLFLLKKKVGFATCGTPKELPNLSNYSTGYNQDQLKHITSICDKIITKSEFDPIRFSCTVILLHHGEEFSETTVFRIVSPTGNFFIDTNARIYQNWEQYMKTNTLPDCEYCFPLNGEYKDVFEVGFKHSPASSIMKKAIGYADTAGSLASIASASVFASSFAIAVAPAALAVAGTTATCTAVYCASRSAGTLLDRNKHEQSIGLDNSESRSAWLNLGASAMCAGTGAALGKAKKIVESGKSLGNMAKCGLHAMTATSLVFSGYGFVETLINCVDKYNKEELTKKDIFDLSCELLFLFNALASAKATTNLVNSMSIVSESSFQKKLTKTQKRNLRRRAAKRRAKGLPSSVKAENSNNISGTNLSNLQSILLKAAIAFVPRVETILYNCQNIIHDIKCWKEGGLQLPNLLCNITMNITELYNKFKYEIDEIKTKVEKYFRSLNCGRYNEIFFQWFYSATEEVKSCFFSKIINVEDEVDAMINEAENYIDSHEQVEAVELDEIANDAIEGGSDCNDLSSECQSLLSKCEHLCFSEVVCSNLEDFGDVLDEAKNLIVNEFKRTITKYKQSVEAAKSASNSFDINVYNEALGIKGDVIQHFFNEIIEELTTDSSIYKIMNKYNQIKRDRKKITAPVWSSITDGIYQYFGTHGAGRLLEEEILSLVSTILSKELYYNNNCKWVDSNSNISMIEISNGDGDMEIIVSHGLNEENTSFGFVIIVK